MIEFTSGDLHLVFVQHPDGLQLTEFRDTARSTEFLGNVASPLFSLSVRNRTSGETIQLDGGSGWRNTSIDQTAGSIVLHWKGHREIASENPAAIQVELKGRPVDNGISWTIDIAALPLGYSLMDVVFPQVSVCEWDANLRLFFPRGPGEEFSKGWGTAFEYSVPYTSFFCCMALMAVYSNPDSNNQGAGLYIAHEDPVATAKGIAAVTDPDARRLKLSFSHPPENLGESGNHFHLTGSVTWKLFQGDWYDAARMYRDWVRREATWFPKLEANRRDDTPDWMRDGRVWMRLRGNAQTVVPVIKEFARQIQLPVAFHWYNWHQIPYDNDYPHFFPPQPGFEDGVRELQDAGIKVIPYINGRIWDTRDRGTEDYEFSSKGFPNCCKNEEGKPFIETYASRESDGSPVQLAVMCPSTALWKETLAALVDRLYNECGVDGVYIDQVAAAPPMLCTDKTHGHPVGGGHWWVDSYRDLVASIREKRPPNTILVTECNAEPYATEFDGFLTWHWQYENQVPAFQVVYTGAVQFFGRSFRVGPTRFRSLRMKSAQQLVFGEQIGWVEDAEVVKQPDDVAFLRQMARLRWPLREFFSLGEMLRPPKVETQIPTVEGDWRWFEEWRVSLPAVLTGGWYHPGKKQAAWIFVNHSDEAIETSVSLSLPDGVDSIESLSIVDATPGAEFTQPIPHRSGEPFPLSISPSTGIVWMGTPKS